MRKRTEPIPWALEECRGCRKKGREGGGVEFVPLFTPLVVVMDEDSGEGWSLRGLITGLHLCILQRRHPLGQSYNLGKPLGQGQTNKPSLSIPPSYPCPTIHHPSVT